jgi:multidrug resistance efflux pump
MIFVVILYAGLVYLLFFKFRLLPWNMLTQGITLLVGVVLLLGFLVGLRLLTPASTQAGITARIVEIAPQVSGRVIAVHAQRNVTVEAGAKLFSIDPTPYQAKVQELEARLTLSRRRVDDYLELVEAGAGSEFQLEQTEAETQQLEAQLTAARFNLKNTDVTAPAKGMVPRLFLKEGAQVSPSKSVLAFVDTSELMVGGLFPQKALQTVKIGDKAMVNFPALPGRVFESKVAIIPGAIGDAQITASGQLSSVQAQRMVNLYPIYIELPEDFPENMRKVGLAAQIYIHTEGAGVISPVANAMQFISSSLQAIL